MPVQEPFCFGDMTP